MIAAPAVLFILLGALWLAGFTLPERIVARLTTSVYALLTVAVSILGWRLARTPGHSIHASLGDWFTVGDYGFPIELLADTVSFPLIAATVILVGLVGSFSVRYLHRDPGFLRFFLLLNLFAFGALLVFASASMDLLVAGWEFVGITSVLLISFFQYRPEPVRNALRVFATYRLADLFILLAVFLAHHWVGSTAWSALFGTGAVSGAKTEVLAILLVFAVSGKSAQGPFSGWLPRAMEGPTPSSAVFYGAISVHAGAYLLLRAEPLVQGSHIARGLLFAIGGGTALVSTMVHRTCADAKTSLAYASQTQLGIIFCEIAAGWSTLALLHICSHAMARSMQFLRAPSMLYDHHRIHSASGGTLQPTGEHLEALLPKFLQIYLYRVALGRGFYDAIVDRWILAPARSLAGALRIFEPDWIRIAPQNFESKSPAEPTHTAESSHA
jgi:NADH-quinone oxidoreductase subunit L